MVGPMRKSLLSKAVTAVCATVMCLGVTACGGNSSAKSDKSNSDSSSSSEKIGMHQIAGVTAKGELGKKPTVSFKTPMTVEDNSYVVLQKGDVVQVLTPGAGGWGDARLRNPEKVLRDVMEGDVSPQSAEQDYGVALSGAPGKWEVDVPSEPCMAPRIPPASVWS